MNITAQSARIWRISLLAGLLALGGLLAAGCGGDSSPQGTAAAVKLEVARWVFPKRQPLGTPVTMKIVIRNVDTRDVKQLAVTIGGLREPVTQQNSDGRTRPVWIVNEGERDDATPYDTLTTSTYDLGTLAAGQSKTFEMPLTPLRRGEHEVSYKIGDGVVIGTPAETADGSPLAAKRLVVIDPTPEFDESAFD